MNDEVCVTFTYEQCSAEPVSMTCPVGEECDTGTQADTGCTTETEGYCLPPYLAPCEKSSDCGAGFECVEQESCACSSGGSTGGSTGGSIGVDGDEAIDAGSTSTDAGRSETECSCSPTGDFYCDLIETECTSDGDCAGDMVCDELYGQGGETTVCVSSPDGGTECDVDAGSSTEATLYCQPDDLERWIGAAGHVYGGTSYDEATGGSNGGTEGGERDVLSSEVDRGSGATSGGGGGGSESAGCASTGLAGSAGGAAGGMLGFMMVVAFGLAGARRRR
jgi:hypothetical protein